MFGFVATSADLHAASAEACRLAKPSPTKRNVMS